MLPPVTPRQEQQAPGIEPEDVNKFPAEANRNTTTRLTTSKENKQDEPMEEDSRRTVRRLPCNSLAGAAL